MNGTCNEAVYFASSRKERRIGNQDGIALLDVE
jgi:hypothetical protein